MTDKDRNDLRRLILTGLRADDRGRPAKLLLTDARSAGIGATLPELVTELRQMADDSHVAIIDLPYAETRYCITERGRAALIQSEL